MNNFMLCVYTKIKMFKFKILGVKQLFAKAFETFSCYPDALSLLYISSSPLLQCTFI